MKFFNRIKKVVAVTLAITTVLCTPVLATEADYYDIGFMKFNGVYVNRWGQPIPNVESRGIDVSSYQGVIDWAKVAQDDVSFVFVRCGATNSGPDKMFDANASGANAHGIPLGLYYRSYCSTDEMATLEAQYTVLCAQKYNVTLPLVYDIEGTTMANLGTERLQRNIEIFCKIVKDAGYTPMVYTSKSFMNTYIKSTPCTKWIARYGDSFDYTGGNTSYWQCSSHGFVNGIQGRVDIDFKLK